MYSACTLCVHCVQCMSSVFIVCLTGAGPVPCGLCVIPMAGQASPATLFIKEDPGLLGCHE